MKPVANSERFDRRARFEFALFGAELSARSHVVQSARSDPNDIENRVGSRDRSGDSNNISNNNSGERNNFSDSANDDAAIFFLAREKRK